MIFPQLYETLGRHPFGFTSRAVDAMEVWEVVSMLGIWKPEEELTEAVAKPGKPVDDAKLIRARYAAAARGEPEPVHLLGAPMSSFAFPPSPNME